MGSITGEKRGNMEILNWKFNEQSSRHGQLRATILRKYISHHVFHLLLRHVHWCQKRLVSLSLTKDGQQQTWTAKHGLFFRKWPATLGSSITEFRDALFMETLLFILYESLLSLGIQYETSCTWEMALQNRIGTQEKEAVLKNYW